MAGKENFENAIKLATKILDEGLAWKKFQAICEAQGGLRLPQKAPFTHEITSPQAGYVTEINNRKLAMVAKLAGAPEASSAGVFLHAPLHHRVEKGESLFRVDAETHGELAYALEYVLAQDPILQISEENS